MAQLGGGVNAAWPAAAYPKEMSLRDDSTVSVRPLEAKDAEALLAFFRDIPERERFFLKDDVTLPAVIADWVRGTERAFALIALISGHIVGEATLVRRRGKARSHVADVRVVVAQDARGRGLGTALIGELTWPETLD